VSTVDRILELLDNTGQQTGEQAATVIVAVGGGPPGEGASGVCDECRTVLLDEETAPTDEAPSLLQRVLLERLRRIGEPQVRGMEPFEPWQQVVLIRMMSQAEIEAFYGRPSPEAPQRPCSRAGEFLAGAGPVFRRDLLERAAVPPDHDRMVAELRWVGSIVPRRSEGRITDVTP